MQAPTPKTSPRAAIADGRPSGASEAEKAGGEVAIHVKSGGSHGEDGRTETEVCRICHLTPGRDGDGDEEEVAATSAAGELIQIGFACKGELGSAHRQCAEAWFRAKGDRYCEICGANAKNINGEEDDGGFMEEWHARRTIAMSRGSSSDRAGCLRDQPLCNLFVACLVIAFIILCFFRVNLL